MTVPVALRGWFLTGMFHHSSPDSSDYSIVYFIMLLFKESQDFSIMDYLFRLFRLIFCSIAVFCAIARASAEDSSVPASDSSAQLLPKYYIRLNLSRFFLQSDAFYKRQYLAEGGPALDFHLLTMHNITFIINTAFRLGMGEIPDGVRFNFIDLTTNLDPFFEIPVGDYLLSTGLSHNCIHEVDTSEFPITYYNVVHLALSSPQSRLNKYYSKLAQDTLFSIGNRISWQVEADYYLKQFFGLVDPGKLNGYWPNIFQLASEGRYAIYRKYDWIFTLFGEAAIGIFDKNDGFTARSGSGFYWKVTTGVQAFFTRGREGGSFYLKYYLDDMPARKKDPPLTRGNARFSRNGLLEIGFQVFN